ncbi:MAG: glucose-1-phosphate adenylyltransferase, partial [Desulfobulbaceae bacterium]|nr:glucose-1-phosphate adenylyltransferase [Desulfobulbaceae bacterium]
PMAQAGRFGVADIDNEDGDTGGRVLRYKEKPSKPKFNWASMTILCFKPKTLYEILEINALEDDSFEFGRNIIPRMMFDQRKVFGFKFYGYWGYTRTIEEYWQTNMDLLGPNPGIKIDEWAIRTNLEHRDIRDRQPLKIGLEATVQDSLIYNGCVVEGHVERSILFPGVHVKKGAIVKDSVLFFENIVSRNVRLKKVVSDVNVVFENGARVGGEGPSEDQEASVIGWNNRIPANSVIGSDCTLYPGLKPEKLNREIKTGEIVR